VHGIIEEDLSSILLEYKAYVLIIYAVNRTEIQQQSEQLSCNIFKKLFL